jgi:DNA-binding response OmpR family regulator
MPNPHGWSAQGPEAGAGLPREGQIEARYVMAAAGERASLEGVSVLLVEDSWHVAVAIKALLENAGLLVEGPAGNLARAEALLEAGEPDVAIVDLNVRGRMSYDLIDKLIQRGVPVVVMSGYEDLAGLERRVDATLEKPVKAGALLAALRGSLEAKRRR